MPSCTVTVNPCGRTRAPFRITSSITSWRICPSGRVKMLSTSARLMTPIRCPVAFTTGSLLTRRSRMSRAASTTGASGPMVTAGLDISSPAVTPAAFSWNLKRSSPAIVPGLVAWSASLLSMSASDTTPTTLPP